MNARATIGPTTNATPASAIFSPIAMKTIATIAKVTRIRVSVRDENSSPR
jgi:hypothetical protein